MRELAPWAHEAPHAVHSVHDAIVMVVQVPSCGQAGHDHAPWRGRVQLRGRRGQDGAWCLVGVCSRCPCWADTLWFPHQVKDPWLVEHLKHWGIDAMSLKKTAKTMDELSIELNLKCVHLLPSQSCVAVFRAAA